MLFSSIFSSTSTFLLLSDTFVIYFFPLLQFLFHFLNFFYLLIFFYFLTLFSSTFLLLQLLFYSYNFFLLFFLPLQLFFYSFTLLSSTFFCSFNSLLPSQHTTTSALCQSSTLVIRLKLTYPSCLLPLTLSYGSSFINILQTTKKQKNTIATFFFITLNINSKIQTIISSTTTTKELNVKLMNGNICVPRESVRSCTVVNL